MSFNAGKNLKNSKDEKDNDARKSTIKELLSEKLNNIIGFKDDNVYYLTKIAKMADIRKFADELVEEFQDFKYNNIDNYNKRWSDEIEAEFYQDAADKAGLKGWEVDYLFWHLGY